MRESNTGRNNAEFGHGDGDVSESLQVVRAIREGAVDAFVVGEGADPKIYTLMGMEHPYRMIIESMREGAVVLTMDGTILYSNASFARIVRAPLDHVAGAPLARYTDSSNVDRLGDLLGTSGEQQMEMTLRADDGTPVPVLISRTTADLVAAEGICLIVTDLSDQKRHERIVASERLTRLILEQAAEAILVCDDSGIVIHASRAAERLCGGSPLWRPFDELFELRLSGENKLADYADHLSFETLSERTISTLEVARKLPAGDEAYLLLSAAPIRNDDGETLGTMIILIEATDQMLARSALHETERKLRSQIRSLEDRVAERAVDLARANEALDALNREMRDLAFVASHFLQEPLRKIVAFGDLLAREAAERLSEDGSSYISRIQHAARHMSDLIHDLLTFSRVQMRDVTFQETNLTEIAVSVREDLQDELAECHGTIEIGDLPLVEANPSQMKELFRQLISNAVRFRRDGVPPQISVKSSERILHKEDGVRSRLIELEVADNGIGFDPKYVERMFSPFQQLHRSTHPGGTGIGLTICRRIVERHGGSIRAEGEPGDGSRFIVQLPVRQDGE